ncbi:MAG: hypothetical protein ACOC6F_00490 [bacterium]
MKEFDMPSPLSHLVPALEVLAENAEILPATGQAVEDLMRPHQEEVEDEILNNDALRTDTLIETPNRDVYQPTPGLARRERHVFRYFLDGSRRSYFIGTALEHERSTPIQVAQIGAAVVHRREDGEVETARSKRKLLLLLSRENVSDHVWEQLKAQEGEGLRLEDISEEDQLTEAIGNKVDLRSRGGGKVNWAMHQLEIKLANSLSEREESEWLIVDGSLNFEPPIDTPQTIGVAKSFTKRPVFTIGRGPRKETYPLYRLLSGLPAAHRTCAFSARSGRVAFWYVRMREQRQMDYPMMGVVKVEMRNPSAEAIPSEKIDLISRGLVAERSVTPYGSDARWHAHLYPIYLAEQVVKNGFWSREVIRTAIHWPRRPIDSGSV